MHVTNLILKIKHECIKHMIFHTHQIPTLESLLVLKQKHEKHPIQINN